MSQWIQTTSDWLVTNHLQIPQRNGGHRGGRQPAWRVIGEGNVAPGRACLRVAAGNN